MIIEANAAEHRAGAIVEAANYPVTPTADKLARRPRHTVIPDILANAGGVTGSYFEWSQNIQQFTWKEERFSAELLDRMQGFFHFTQAFADEHHVTLRQAGLRHRHPAGGGRRPPPRLRRPAGQGPALSSGRARGCLVSSSSVRCQPQRTARRGWPSSGPEASSSSPGTRGGRGFPRGGST